MQKIVITDVSVSYYNTEKFTDSLELSPGEPIQAIVEGVVALMEMCHVKPSTKIAIINNRTNHECCGGRCMK